MDITPTHSLQTIVLADLFRVHDRMPLRETVTDECHSFMIYGARNALVREAAYLRAQARGFEPGHELEDWRVAEHEIDARIFATIAPIGFVG